MLNNEQEQIKLKVEEIVRNEGVELLEIRIFFSGGKYIVRCIVDYLGGGVTIDNCAFLNSKIFSFLEESNLLGENFVVEVNSPGLDRPLKTHKDFLRVRGRRVSLWFNEPVEGRDFLEAEVIDANEKQLILKNRENNYQIDFSKIKIGKEKVGL
jgi:ribosome maturation factor RimP